MVLCGTDDTILDPHQKTSYANIAILNEMKPAGWELLNCVEKQLKTSTFTGDWFEAITVATNCIDERIADGISYQQTQIVLFPTKFSHIDPSKRTEDKIFDKLKQLGTEVVIIKDNFLHIKAEDGIDLQKMSERSEEFVNRILQRVSSN